MELPIVASIPIQGALVKVRAAPFSLVSDLARSGGGPDSPAIAQRILERCCSLEDGSQLDFDSLSSRSANQLIQLAIRGEGPGTDFPSPPGSSGSGG